ncbi:hypothetical protein [Terrihalobacillus insolitus]|uniref:hypothetical protein n=1 Tax=Terrihalobacillus insolitus TaxID=2950438 RepID=UPI002341C72F|nr:hypothetical protein [Terrihalobacillus insolitus]MDC3414754.1 hypothetical protein [Terrihalobacillus insolitus]
MNKDRNKRNKTKLVFNIGFTIVVIAYLLYFVYAMFGTIFLDQKLNNFDLEFLSSPIETLVELSVIGVLIWVVRKLFSKKKIR